MVNSLSKTHSSLYIHTSRNQFIQTDTANYLGKKKKKASEDRRWHHTHTYLHIVANESKHEGITIPLDFTK